MKSVALYVSLIYICSATPMGGRPVPPRVSGIAFVRLYVTSLEQSRDFYSKTLGLRGTANCPAHDASLCIRINGSQELRLSAAPSAVPANLVAEIAYAVPDVAAMRRYLLKRGLQPSSIESTSVHSLQFSISSQEGHKITFIQRPKRYTIFEGPHQPTSQSLIHVGSVVHDRVAEDAFYKDILGFHLYWHGGMKDDRDDWVDMQVPDGTDWIEFMLNVPANADHHTLGVMNHIALGVPDIKAVKKQLLKNGWKPGEEPKIGRDGKWQLNLYDPDDTRVEFMEFTPVQKPCCSEYTGPHPGQKQ